MTPEFLINLSYQQVLGYFVDEFPGKKEHDFRTEIFSKVWLLDNDKLEESTAILNLLTDSQERARTSKFGYILLTTVYVIRAMKAFDKKEKQLTWSYIADARYWCGATITATHTPEQTENTIKEARKSVARSGGNARAKKLDKIKQEAFRLSVERKPKINGWKSRLHASKMLADEVYKFSQKNSYNVIKSRDSFNETLYKWLKDAPMAELLFPNRKKSR